MAWFSIRSFLKSLRQPQRFFFLCLAICFFTLVFDASLWRLYALHKQEQILRNRIHLANEATRTYQGLIEQAKDPHYLKKLAREKFDWLEEDELLYLFPSENPSSMAQ